MKKFKVVFDGYEEPELYDTFDEADDAALVILDNYNTGNENLCLENRGDFPEENDGNTAVYEIIEIEI